MKVAECIESQYADIYVNNVMKHGTDTIFMTLSPADQGGDVHINCQPKDYWVEKISKKGYIYTDEYKDDIRNIITKAGDHVTLAAVIIDWFEENYMVFKKEITDEV